MPRQALPEPPDFTAPGLERQFSTTINCRLVTPTYGGGYEAGVSDPTTPVRASGIRGALRWWWRASQGAAFPSIKDLKLREDKIWGSTDLRSPVTVEVLKSQLSPGIDAKHQEQGRTVFSQPQYALFPAQSDVVRKIHPSGSFTLRLRYPLNPESDIQSDIDTAVRAFLWLGGVGARTRRGLGCLLPEAASGYALSKPNIQLPALAKPALAPPQWPVLSGSRCVIGSRCSPNEAWVRAIELYKGYRQARRDGSSTRPGRSYWPEPDAIRSLRNMSSLEHSQRVTADDIFPRAQFGLPIIFHFKSFGDPSPDNTLVIDKDHDRMSSPVILKPLVISDKEAYPLLLVLNAPPCPAKLTLLQQGATDLRVDTGTIDMLEFLVQTAERDWNTKRRVL